MKKSKKIASIIMTVGIMVSLPWITAMAADEITAVSLNITVNIEPGYLAGKEDIKIEKSSGKGYHISEYKINNHIQAWTENDSPSVQVTLTSEEGYVFADLKSEDVTLLGNDLKLGSVSRRDDSKTLLVTFTKPPLSQTMVDVKDLKWVPKGIASWNPVAGAGSYEVRLYRGGKLVGQTVTVTDTSYDFTKKMILQASYTFQVRAVSGSNASVKGQYVSSDICSVNQDLAIAFKKGAGWECDSTGWWYRYADGTFPVNAWLQVKGLWYYFNDQGYMLENQVTPDGYRVGEGGVLVS